MYSSLSKWYFVTLTGFAAVLLFLAPCWGADWAITPRIHILEEYNDNILFDPEEEELDDWVTYAKAGVEASCRTQRFHLSLDSDLEIEKYIDYDELNTTDHTHKLAFSSALSKNLGLRAGGYFREDTTLETELEEEGLLVGRENRRKWGGDLGLSYVFSTRVSLSGDWTRRYSAYPDDPDAYDDRRSDTLDLVSRYALSPKASLFLKMGYTETEYDRPGDFSITNYNVKTSFRYDFTEHSYFSGGAGYRYTKEEKPTDDEHSDGLVYELSFHRDWGKVLLRLVVSRDQYSSVDERSVERSRLTLEGTYRLGPRFRTGVAATFRRNRIEGGEDYEYYALSPSASYDLTRRIILKGSADYSEYGYLEDSDRDRERFRARLALSFLWPRLLGTQ